jgi:hypothetical protein
MTKSPKFRMKIKFAMVAVGVLLAGVVAAINPASANATIDCGLSGMTPDAYYHYSIATTACDSFNAAQMSWSPTASTPYNTGSTPSHVASTLWAGTGNYYVETGFIYGYICPTVQIIPPVGPQTCAGAPLARHWCYYVQETEGATQSQGCRVIVTGPPAAGAAVQFQVHYGGGGIWSYTLAGAVSGHIWDTQPVFPTTFGVIQTGNEELCSHATGPAPCGQNTPENHFLQFRDSVPTSCGATCVSLHPWGTESACYVDAGMRFAGEVHPTDFYATVEGAGNSCYTTTGPAYPFTDW